MKLELELKTANDDIPRQETLLSSQRDQLERDYAARNAAFEKQRDDESMQLHAQSESIKTLTSELSQLESSNRLAEQARLDQERARIDSEKDERLRIIHDRFLAQ